MSKYYPLSNSEQGLYISSLTSGDAYNLANTVNLGKDVSFEQVQNALKAVFNAHPYLFTILSIDDDGNIVKHIEEEDIKLESKFQSDLGADSLDTVELIMEFERVFEVSIPDDQAEKISTVEDAVKFIEDHLEK